MSCSGRTAARNGHHPRRLLRDLRYCSKQRIVVPFEAQILTECPTCTVVQANPMVSNMRQNGSTGPRNPTSGVGIVWRVARSQWVPNDILVFFPSSVLLPSFTKMSYAQRTTTYSQLTSHWLIRWLMHSIRKAALPRQT